MLRHSLLLVLLLAFLAGPALAYSTPAGPMCDDMSMASGSGGGCGGDDGASASVCSTHCAAAVGIVAAVAQPHAVAALPASKPSSSAGKRASPPDTAPPKA